MEYKTVTNPDRPGRPPANSAWVRDDDNNILRNDKGEFAFRPLTAAEIAEKAAGKKKSGGKKSAAKKASAKKGSGRKATPELAPEMKSALLLKKTYKDFSTEDLIKIRENLEDLISKAKDAEIQRIKKEIESRQSLLEQLENQ